MASSEVDEGVGPFAYDVLDARQIVLSPRSRALIITEITGLERLLKQGQMTGDGSEDLRRVADRYTELRAAAEREVRLGVDVERASKTVSAASKSAVKYYGQLSSSYPSYPHIDEAYYFAAIESVHRDDLSDARDRFNQLIQQVPSSRFVPQAYFAYGELFRLEAANDASKWTQAAAAYREAAKYPVAQNPIRCAALMRISAVAEAEGLRNEAMAFASDALNCIRTNASSQHGAERVVREATKANARLGSSGALVASNSPPAPADVAPVQAKLEAPQPVRLSSAFQVNAATPQPSSYALIIGIETYRTLPAPTGARTDALRMEAVMKRTFGIPNQRMRVLTDANATRSDIIAAIDWLKANAKSGSRVYFYFSGHGSPEPTSGSAYLLPYESSTDNLLASGIQVDEVLRLLGQTKAREVIAMVDSCFSGTGDRSVLPPGTRALSRVKEPVPSSRVVLLSASQAKQTSGPAKGESVGLFTKFLSEGLGLGGADIDGDRQITARELFDWVSPRVARDALDQHRSQTPQLTLGAGVSADDVVIGYGY